MGHTEDGLGKPGHGLADADGLFILFLQSLFTALAVFICCFFCCYCFEKCSGGMNLRRLNAGPRTSLIQNPHARIHPVEQEGRARAGCVNHRNVNRSLVGQEQQSKINHVERPHRHREMNYETKKSDKTTNTNLSSLSFGPNQVVKYNCPKHAPISESRPSDDFSQSRVQVPPELPTTSPPSALTTFATSQINNSSTITSTGNTSTYPNSTNSHRTIDTLSPNCCYPHYLQSVARPCSNKTQPRPERRVDGHPQLPEMFQSFLNSQIHENIDNTELEMAAGAPLLLNRYPTFNTFPQNSQTNQPSELPGNIQKPETTHLFPQEQNDLENPPIAQVNDSQNVTDEPQKPHTTSGIPADSFDFSAPLNLFDPSLFSMGTSRLPHYRGSNISTDVQNINYSDPFDPRSYCVLCGHCTLVCKCFDSDETENAGKTKDTESPKNK